MLDCVEFHNAICENNCVLYFIVEALEDPNPHYIIIQP
jgi:hypothetical protein